MMTMVAEVTTFILTYSVWVYRRRWLNDLAELETSYGCTYPSLYINTTYLKNEERKTKEYASIVVVNVLVTFLVFILIAQIFTHSKLIKQLD